MSQLTVTLLSPGTTFTLVGASGLLPPPPKLSMLGDRVMNSVAGMTATEIEDLLEYIALIKRRRKRKSRK